MRLSPLLVAIALALWPAPASAQTARPAAAEEPFTLTRGIELKSRVPRARGAPPVEEPVTAELYRPRREGRVPAAVIINSSGGISPAVELYYARLLAANGMAALVVDSFGPRGVRRTGDDQNRVPQTASDADGFAGYRYLREQPFIDPDRIFIMGLSRGGEAAVAALLEPVRRRHEATDTRFAAHVAIAPGGCGIPYRDVSTTRVPVFFMLAERDDGTPVAPCLTFVERLKAAGHTAVRFAVYPGVFHAFEGAGTSTVPEDWTARRCVGRFERDEYGVIYERASGQRATQGNQTAFLFEQCLERGYTVGGDHRVRDQAAADLLQFLRDVDVLADPAARAVVPFCDPITDPAVRRNCARARAGWTGDLLILGRAFRTGRGVERDPQRALPLLALAADRGSARARFELAQIYRLGEGVPRDPARALALAREAALSGDAPGQNLYGVMIRDGIGRARDDAEAVVWFRRAADQRHGYGLANLGQMLAEGRGGLARDPAGAIVLWRQAVRIDDNPWAQVQLARALADGRGVPTDVAEARLLFEAAAAQTGDPEVARLARVALERLAPQR